MPSDTLTPAAHEQDHLYWEGGNYELNMSFDALRDKQWQRVLQTIWAHPRLYGPLDARYVPGADVNTTLITTPQPTATQTQHGQIAIGSEVAGCDVLATRSLFECVSVLVPLGMFADIILNGGNVRQVNPQLAALDEVFYEIALSVYDAVPFRLAVVGWERECQVPAELRSDAEQRALLIRLGNFLAQESLLQSLHIETGRYELVREGLHWAAPGG